MGSLFIFLGVLALPDGGLMFALPYVLLIPGIVFMASGGFIILITRVKKSEDLYSCQRR